MSDLLTAARQALPGLEWRLAPSGEVRGVITGVRLLGMWSLGNGGVHAYIAGVNRTASTAAEAAQWLRAQVESRRNALDTALGDSDRFKLAGLALLVERWPTCPHAEPYCATLTRGGDCTCGAAEADLARAEARRLVGVEP